MPHDALTMVATEVSKRERHIYIVDDDPDVRKSLHLLLTSASFAPRSFAVANDFIEEVPHLAPGPVLLDIRMAEIDGLQVLEMLNQRAIAWPVIMMTAHGDVSTAVRAIKLGAIEFIEKPFGADVLLDAMGQAFSDLEEMIPLWERRDDARRLLSQLSQRESEVLEMLMEGAANKQVAHKLGISVRTVEEHRRNGLAKLGVKSMAEVVALATLAEIAPGMLLRTVHGDRAGVVG